MWWKLLYNPLATSKYTWTGFQVSGDPCVMRPWGILQESFHNVSVECHFFASCLPQEKPEAQWGPLGWGAVLFCGGAMRAKEKHPSCPSVVVLQLCCPWDASASPLGSGISQWWLSMDSRHLLLLWGMLRLGMTYVIILMMLLPF